MLVYGKYDVSSCRCCMFVSCVHSVAVLNAVFCVIRPLLVLRFVCQILPVNHNYICVASLQNSPLVGRIKVV